MSMQKSSKDLILINCQEVPETICVETRFITKSGKQKNIEQIFHSNACFGLDKDEPNSSTKTVQTTSKTPDLTVSITPKLISAMPNTITNATGQQYQLPQQTQPPNSFVPSLTNLNSNNTLNSLSASNDLLRPVVATQLNNASQLTSLRLNNAVVPTPQMGITNSQNVSNILRCFSEQIQQTDISALNTNSIAIQCKLDDEFEELDVEWPAMSSDASENCEGTENEMESFLKFIEDNSAPHKNYKECLICGELCRSNKYFYGHMAVHRGPKALCFKCGQYLDHENLLISHKCRKVKKLEKAFLKCPHFSCNVTAISRLELYDHINEHTDSRIYKCSACHKGFCTGQEFLRHILIRAKCYTNAKRKRFRLYGLESQSDRQCRVRVFTLHTYKKCTTLVKTFLSQRALKKRICTVCFKSLSNKYSYSSHRNSCIARFKKRLLKNKNK